MDLSSLPELKSRLQLNAAAELLDARVSAGDGARVAFYSPTGVWSYLRLLETANRMANVLVNDFGLLPGNRVLLQGPNTPELAACWLAVLKAGGVVVSAISMLRARELQQMSRKAAINFCICASGSSAECHKAVAGDDPQVKVMHLDGSSSLYELQKNQTDSFCNCNTAAN